MEDITMASPDDSGEYIFVTSFYSKKAGRRIYASEYGKKPLKFL
jgi:hypothetical protein